jgi:hypothetical protein
MKIKVGDWKVDSKTLFRVEWRKTFTKVILHEKIENKVKWTLRILTVIGIGTSLDSLPPNNNLQTKDDSIVRACPCIVYVIVVRSY